MKEDLVINLVPLEVPRSSISIYVSPASDAGANLISARHVGGGDNDPKWSWDLHEFPGSSAYEVSASNVPVLKRIARKSLHAYLVGRGLIVSPDFIDRLKILQFDHTDTPHNTDVYKTFVLRVLAPKEQHASQPQSWHLSISYDGETEISKIPLRNLGATAQFASRVVVGRSLRKAKDLTEDERNSDWAHAVINGKIRSSLGLPIWGTRPENKYKKLYDESAAFLTKHLKGATLGNGCSVYDTGFQPIAEGQVIQASQDSNILVFGDNHTHYNPYNGLKEYGPFQAASDGYKFFFIFHKEDADYANRLYSALNKGLRGFPGLQRFAGLELRLDRGKTINFLQEDPTDEIAERLKAFTPEEHTRYLAIYISRIKKDNPDEQKKYIYYRIKHALLERNIASQVVYRSNIDSPSFHYFLPNIAVAMLAKLGGIPWRLSRPVKHDLIVGLGAFRERDERLFLGTTVAFRNDGTFIRFDASRVETVQHLIDFFRTVLSAIPKLWPDAKRLVIHFYKRMNEREERAIQTALDALGIRIPYVVLHIVEDVELAPFDLAYSGRMPTSGTCVTLRRGDYLLCNNTRYSNLTGARIDDFPLPIRIKITKASVSDLTNDDVRQLIDEAYQFSRMYWVSVRQKGKPVTVLYSERVAAFGAAFPEQALPRSEVATTSLWFL